MQQCALSCCKLWLKFCFVNCNCEPTIAIYKSPILSTTSPCRWAAGGRAANRITGFVFTFSKHTERRKIDMWLIWTGKGYHPYSPALSGAPLTTQLCLKFVSSSNPTVQVSLKHNMFLKWDWCDIIPRFSIWKYISPLRGNRRISPIANRSGFLSGTIHRAVLVLFH